MRSQRNPLAWKRAVFSVLVLWLSLGLMAEARAQSSTVGNISGAVRDQQGAGVPKAVTVSYNEAARLMDAGARVDGVPMPPQWIPWLAEYVERNYKPEPKKRSRPPSFKGAKRDDR